MRAIRIHRGKDARNLLDCEDMTKNASCQLLVAAALLVGCGGSKPQDGPPPPPPIPLLVAIPETPISSVHVPVSVDLDYVAAKVVQELPKPLTRETVRRQVQPFALAPPVGVVFRHQSEMESLVLRLNGDELVATARVGFRVGGSVEGGSLAMGVASCGERPGEQPAGIEFTLRGKLAWGPDGTFTLAPSPWSLRWTRPCELTAFHVKLEDILNLPGVRGMMQRVVDDAIRKLPQAIRLRPMAEQTWARASKPISVLPGVWLSTRPESLFVGPLHGTGKLLQTSIVLRARPRISSDSTDSVKPMPPLRLATSPDQGFRIDLQARLPLPMVDSMLSRTLRDQRLENDGKPVRIERARVYGGGDKAVVAVTFLEPFRGEVFLRGVPEYDSLANAVRFAHLDFDIASRSFLLKVASRLLHGTIRESIEKAAVLPIGRFLPSLSNLNIPVADGVGSRIAVSRIRPLGVSLDDTTLQAWVRAEGVAALSVGAK